MNGLPSVGTLLRYVWAAPASAVGLLIACPALALGAARIACHTGVLEVTLVGRLWRGRGLSKAWPFVAITFGHVVIAQSRRTQRRVRAHERVHVAQYERLGPLFLLAYPLESLLQALRGGRPYLDNRFEREARRLSRRTEDCRALEGEIPPGTGSAPGAKRPLRQERSIVQTQACASAHPTQPPWITATRARNCNGPTGVH